MVPQRRKLGSFFSNNSTCEQGNSGILKVLLLLIFIILSPDSPHGGLFEGGGLFARNPSVSGSMFEGSILEGRDLLEPLRYALTSLKIREKMYT